MFGKTDKNTGEEIPSTMELVRLAFPRRVYTQAHLDYAVEAILLTFEKRKEAKGMRITWAPPFLRHFTAKFEQVS